MKVAIFGCLHGRLDKMFQSVESYENENNTTIDFILVCGDCQTIRHRDDLKCLAVPVKYQQTGDFPEYYSGEKKVPKLTIFIGGNHEASNYLMTLPYGGWVCDNMYYMGFAGVVRYKGLRIVGVSGIYNYHNHKKARFETMPLNDDTMRSIYHTRELDVFRLQLLSRRANEQNRIDMFLSHDWPAKIYDYGNKEQLLKFKPHFRDDVRKPQGLGSPLTQPLVNELKPKKWFAAHLHCRFYAKVDHDKEKNIQTEFLSLNKIEDRLKREFYMEVMDVETAEDSKDILYHDAEWLTILRKTIDLEFNARYCIPKINDRSGQEFFVSEEEIEETIGLMGGPDGLKIERNFIMTEPVIYGRPGGVQPSLDKDRLRFHKNPQHEELCTRLHLRTRTLDPLIEEDFKTETNSDSKREFQDNVKFGKSGVNTEPPSKRVCQTSPVTLDEDGCLPFYIDTKGDK